MRSRGPGAGGGAARAPPASEWLGKQSALPVHEVEDGEPRPKVGMAGVYTAPTSRLAASGEAPLQLLQAQPVACVLVTQALKDLPGCPC